MKTVSQSFSQALRKVRDECWKTCLHSPDHCRKFRHDADVGSVDREISVSDLSRDQSNEEMLVFKKIIGDVNKDSRLKDCFQGQGKDQRPT